MKVLLYSEGKNLFSKSGVGKALEHQMKALELNGVSYTLNPEDNYDIAHINTIGIKSLKLLRELKKRKIPVICHTHTTYEDYKNSFFFSNFTSKIIKFQLKLMYNMADFLIYPSNYTKQLIKSYDIHKKGAVISNGVDINEFENKKEKLIEKFKKEFEIDKPIIMSAGLPFERKGVIDFYELAQEMPEYNFIWFGAKMTKLLPKKIKNILENPPKNLIFPGYVSREVLLGAYLVADVFCFPSYEENEGIVVLEALAAKTPIIIRDIPVYRDWLKDKKHCMKAKNKDDFKKLISLIIEKKIKLNGYEVAKERELETIGKYLKSIYEYLVYEEKEEIHNGII
ncbi:1,2-diacylglycerol-3-alpha-glucose alpha-1,2-glucosyltransferase [Hypnocyclicus thermotrophus]|uniref:1,2-diacylglycerol-3-alpha-glucose alpha-1,2-glucosyltransferase n=1 Tax=Hypnocyclicus thermotrophus TaxID=1627895 RepID=A0AA46DXZ8_9FUSO|nr:glycosyltransferase [Hypnocyclicus thermotrophus]TDT68521.1 1,2-diacylglycerol-3-alpha-glucose alpha-1,2-glucosyltransferase [Hypnocyclicus thermotrophus]